MSKCWCCHRYRAQYTMPAPALVMNGRGVAVMPALSEICVTCWEWTYPWQWAVTT